MKCDQIIEPTINLHYKHIRMMNKPLTNSVTTVLHNGSAAANPIYLLLNHVKEKVMKH